MMRHPIFIVIAMLLLQGCFTPAKEKELKQDIYNLQTRLLQLEKNSTDSMAANSQKTQKSVGSVQSDMERIRIELQKIKGEMGTLQMGIQSGELPGTDESEPSVAKTLSSMVTRLETLEINQSELLKALKSTGIKTSSSSSKKSSIRSLTGMRNAFNKGRYKAVSLSGSKMVKQQKSTRAKEEALYLFAESLFKLGQMRESALKFNDFSERYQTSKLMPHIKMRMGDCFRNLGDATTAKLYYQELVDTYPKSVQAQKAKDKLGRLKSKGASNKLKKKSKYAKSGSKRIKTATRGKKSNRG